MFAGHYKAYLQCSDRWFEMDHGESYQEMDPFLIQDTESIFVFVYKKD